MPKLSLDMVGKAIVLGLVWACWSMLNLLDEGLAELAALALPETVRRGFLLISRNRAADGT